MIASKCMGCGKRRDIPTSTAITPCSECGSTGIITYWPFTTAPASITAPVVMQGTVTMRSSWTAT